MPENRRTEEESTPQESGKDDSVRCDNHPDREGRTFTGGGVYEIHLCDECTPSWFKDE